MIDSLTVWTLQCIGSSLNKPVRPQRRTGCHGWRPPLRYLRTLLFTHLRGFGYLEVHAFVPPWKHGSFGPRPAPRRKTTPQDVRGHILRDFTNTCTSTRPPCVSTSAMWSCSYLFLGGVSSKDDRRSFQLRKINFVWCSNTLMEFKNGLFSDLEKFLKMV